MRRGLNGMKSDEAVDTILNLFQQTKQNSELVQKVKKMKLFKKCLQKQYRCDTMNPLFKRQLVTENSV